MSATEDIDREIAELQKSVTARDARQAVKHLLKAGGEIAGLLTVGVGAATLAATVLPGIGIPIAGGTLAIIAKKAMEGYDKLDPVERKAVRVLVAYARKTVGGV
ncbi:hypothetical protein Sru01_64790 [Sphaerisporangium rufum]|uniref:Uncharacterized protein n=1 Tax=Sphaerisporangium rufum TaxID=1381558 RepID=A0A919R8A4_9ACTN|nr:hypothetical protein [Sphaerisporangium rufum]GII81497.1 hypothetical protein Sru01_64790 [Sphaerisporangium rufum]